MKYLVEFMQKVIANNGATVSTVGLDVPKIGYLVSLQPFGEIVNMYDVNLRTVIKYVDKNQLELSKPNRFLGCWIDKGKLYLDVSTCITYKRYAVYLAFDNSQLAIYDIANDVSIDIPTPQRSGTTTQQKAYITSVVDRLCK